MGKSHKTRTVPNPLEDLIERYNEGQVPKPEFIEKVIPLIEHYRRQKIMYHLGLLVSNNPGRYHISSPHHHELWADAEAAYDATLKAKLALHPGLREKFESFPFSDTEVSDSDVI